ncbi:HERV-H LTR-associating protein 2 [Trichomycterus rosablanca]|uniref:HERV-H LTR-associating protein 2 n=1 Tax=Trichomycterus rosablanca TaxID=2290929 RepID=UPI002F353CC9
MADQCIYLLSSDVHVTCQVSEDCVLPCSFEPSGNEKIHWYRQDVLIYSHPDSSDKSVDRTSMFTEQLDLGNASLLLHQCGPQNRGRYRCRVINGDKEKSSFIVVKVEAPIRSVNLKMTRLSGYEEAKCSTSDVYPAPQVSWSTEPSTPPEKLKYTTRIMADKQGRYSMESKLRRLDHGDLTYICTINSSSTRQTWRAFLTVTVLNNITSTSTSYTSHTWADMNPAEHQNLTIPCKAPWDIQDFTLTWSFTRENRTTDVCKYDSRTDLITNLWKSTAFLEHQRLEKGDASLRLVNLRSLEHTGVYICNISAFQRAHVGQIEVNVTSLAFGSTV